jgi:ABC-2 type transport system permease protein
LSAQKNVDSWADVRPLGRTRELAAISMFIKRDYLQQTHFVFSFLTALVASAFPLVIYGIIAKFSEGAPEIQTLAGGYVNFVISGMVINALLGTALSGPYSSLLESFWNNRIEIIMASPLRLPVFVTGLSAGRYVNTAMRIAIYLAGATLFLGFTWPSFGGILASIAVLVPALLACSGLGLIAASSFYMLDARGGQDPVRFIVETISGLLAGVFFPLQVLPPWAQWIGHLVPHTYAIDGMRRTMFGSDSVPPLAVHDLLPMNPVIFNCLILIVYSAIALPVGWKMFRHSIQLAKRDGRLSRWL